MMDVTKTPSKALDSCEIPISLVTFLHAAQVFPLKITVLGDNISFVQHAHHFPEAFIPHSVYWAQIFDDCVHKTSCCAAQGAAVIGIRRLVPLLLL